LDDLQIALKPALGAAFSDSSKIFCQEMTRFHDEDTKRRPPNKFTNFLRPGLRVPQKNLRKTLTVHQAFSAAHEAE
jgi:hypothetical protein